MDHTILQQKLRVYLNNSSAVRFFQSYLSDRSQYVCANGKFSATGTIQSGVPQGSILGPLLFCIFINDLPLHIPDKKVRNSLFADDSSLDTSGKTVNEIEVTLQKSLNDVSGWCKNNLMCLLNRRMTPSYIISLFTESNNRTNRYVLPKPRIDLYKTSLSFSGSACWNSLPVAIKTVGTIKSFKRALHQYLMGE